MPLTGVLQQIRRWAKYPPITQLPCFVPPGLVYNIVLISVAPSLWLASISSQPWLAARMGGCPINLYITGTQLYARRQAEEFVSHNIGF